MFKKLILLFLSVLFFSKVACATSFSDFDVNEILEKLYVKVAVTIKIDEKKVKGGLTIKEKSFDGNLICSDRYKATVAGKKDGQVISIKLFVYNVKKNKLLYKVTAKGTQDAGRWSLYNGSDVLIAKGKINGRNNDNTEIMDEELYAKSLKTLERFMNACTLN